jgi:hypothetical protein
MSVAYAKHILRISIDLLHVYRGRSEFYCALVEMCMVKVWLKTAQFAGNSVDFYAATGA